MSQKHVDTDSVMVRNIFRDVLGLHVSMIAPSPKYKSPDLLIEFAGVRVLTEVERKTDDQQFRNLLDGEKGGTLQYSAARTEERVKNAWRQVRDYPERNISDSTLVWLIAGQRDTAILTGKAAIARLYGIETLEGYTEAGDYYSKPCYFFYESLFFKYKDLDAVVVHFSEDVSLCLSVSIRTRPATPSGRSTRFSLRSQPLSTRSRKSLQELPFWQTAKRNDTIRTKL